MPASIRRPRGLCPIINIHNYVWKVKVFMPLVFQKRIYKDDLKSNRSALYLFGDNEDRAGLGGQAKECRGEPNAIGVRTKKHPSMSENSFWSDDHYDLSRIMIDEDMEPAFQHLRLGGVVVCPLDGLGTGLSNLPKFAPKTFEYIREKIHEMMRIVPDASTST